MPFPAQSDALEANRFLGRGGKDPSDDPRTPLERLRIRALQQMCKERGYPEATGEGRPSVNGDSTGWTKAQCIKVLEANVTAENRSRPLTVAHKPLGIDELDRIDLLGVLQRDFAFVPPPGTDTEALRALYRQKLGENDKPAPTLGVPPAMAVETKASPVDPTPEAPWPTAEDVKDLTFGDLKKLIVRLGAKAKPQYKRPELISIATDLLKARQQT